MFSLFALSHETWVAVGSCRWDQKPSTEPEQSELAHVGVNICHLKKHKITQLHTCGVVLSSGQLRCSTAQSTSSDTASTPPLLLQLRSLCAPHVSRHACSNMLETGERGPSSVLYPPFDKVCNNMCATCATRLAVRPIQSNNSRCVPDSNPPTHIMGAALSFNNEYNTFSTECAEVQDVSVLNMSLALSKKLSAHDVSSCLLREAIFQIHKINFSCALNITTLSNSMFCILLFLNETHHARRLALPIISSHCQHITAGL